MGICLIVKSGGGVDTSAATATADKILSGYTIYANDNKITGSIGNVGNQNRRDAQWGTANSDYYKAWCGGTVWIWEGWHDGTSGVNAAPISEHTWDCDIPNEWYCLWGYTYWANGVQYSGKMSVRGKKSWSIGANGTQTIEDGWHDGNGTVSQSIPVDATEWGSGGATSDIQLCWPGWYYSQNRWCYGSGDLVPWNIRNGVCIYGVWGTWQTTARWLIENGNLTGLLSSGYWGGTGSYTHTASWNGSNWVLLYAVSWWWGGSDEGYSRNWQGMLYFSDANNFGTISSKHIGFVIRGDFHDAYSGQATSGNRSPVTEAWACYEAKELDVYELPTTTGSGSTLEWTTSGNMSWRSYNYVNDLTTLNRIYFSGRGRGTIKWSYEYTIWAKNLWLETSVSI